MKQFLRASPSRAHSGSRRSMLPEKSIWRRFSNSAHRRVQSNYSLTSTSQLVVAVIGPIKYCQWLDIQRATGADKKAYLLLPSVGGSYYAAFLPPPPTRMKTAPVGSDLRRLLRTISRRFATAISHLEVKGPHV